jgi:beta-glucanase (GH16 family)
MAKSLVLSATLLFGIYVSSDAQSVAKNLLLTGYTVSPDEPVAGRIVVQGGAGEQLLLEGPRAALFQITGDELRLSEKGKKYFRNAERCDITVRTRGRHGVKQMFTIVRNDFYSNPVIAHRGRWKNTGVPQNSIAALTSAISIGVSGSEFDIHMTSDSVLVINHDPDFNGMSIAQTPYAVLAKHRLANGEPLPTFAAYLTEGMRQQHTRLIAELKPSSLGKKHSLKMAEKVIEEVRRVKAQAWMVYISFDYDVLKKLLVLDPYARTQFLTGNASREQLLADGIEGADYHFSVYMTDEQWIKKAHALRLKVNAWTVNDPVMMEYFLIRNIDQITTDEPEHLLKLAEHRNNSKWKHLVWSDEFNYTGLPDERKWDYDTGGHGWGNHELQYYTKADSSNVWVSKGSLHLNARQQQMGENRYTSARLVTRDKAEFTYGKIEMRAKLPEGRGLWPAFWMLGINIREAGWPACGEIDIMEHVGFEPDSVFGTIHTKAYNHMIGTQKGKKAFIDKPYAEFHVYSLEWTPDEMLFMLDGKVYNHIINEHKTKDEWPFDDPHYMLLNIAVGGDLGGKRGVDDSYLPATMVVDYVRVFTY